MICVFFEHYLFNDWSARVAIFALLVLSLGATFVTVEVPPHDSEPLTILGVEDDEDELSLDLTLDLGGDENDPATFDAELAILNLSLTDGLVLDPDKEQEKTRLYLSAGLNIIESNGDG